jgi:pyruvate/2-oxoglutarate dehydrogenase complex dihydrolipoamide acyltransferase (E2) component
LESKVVVGVSSKIVGRIVDVLVDQGDTVAAGQTLADRRTQSWTVKAERSRGGVVLSVTASDPAQTAKIRGLGFMGIMSLGSRHQRHHRAIAKGELVH